MRFILETSDLTIAGPHTAHPPTHRERKRGSGRERAVSGSDSAQTGLHDFTVSPQNRGKKNDRKDLSINNTKT